MEKSKLIEKLFSYIVAYSYLFLPLCYFLTKGRVKIIPITIALYGVIFFLLLKFYNVVPKEYKLYYQGFYTYAEFITFTLILYFSINSKRIKKLIYISAVIFFFFQVFYIPTQNLRKLDSVPIGIETILVFIYIAFFFGENFQKATSSYIYSHYCFWISVGILIYLGGSFFFYILINHLSEDQISTFGTMTYVADIIKNLLFGIALLIYSRNILKIERTKNTSIPYLDMI